MVAATTSLAEQSDAAIGLGAETTRSRKPKKACRKRTSGSAESHELLPSVLLDSALNAHAIDVAESFSGLQPMVRATSCPALVRLVTPSIHTNPYFSATVPSRSARRPSGRRRASARQNGSGSVANLSTSTAVREDASYSTGTIVKEHAPEKPKPKPKQHLPPATPAQISHLPRPLSSKPQRKLRVGIFNACKGYLAPHPAAVSCLTALMHSPWFHSQAVARLLNSTPLPEGKSRSPLSWLPPVESMLIGADDISMGRLCRPNGLPGHGFDVLIVPGGSTAADLRSLGKEGRERIRHFVHSGGGYCGICAGAFLGLKHLRLVDARGAEQAPTEIQAIADDESSGSDGDGEDGDASCKHKIQSVSRDPLTVNTHFTKLGRKLLWSEGRPKRAEAEESSDGVIEMRYHNGPLVQVPKGADSTTLCRMWPTAEASTRSLPEGLSGAAAILMQNFGGGRAVIISPHPESTQESGFGPEPGKMRLRRILQRAVLLAASGAKAHSWIQPVCHLLG